MGGYLREGEMRFMRVLWRRLTVRLPIGKEQLRKAMLATDVDERATSDGAYWALVALKTGLSTEQIFKIIENDRDYFYKRGADTMQDSAQVGRFQTLG
jgi:hypothetical protein